MIIFQFSHVVVKRAPRLILKLSFIYLLVSNVTIHLWAFSGRGEIAIRFLTHLVYVICQIFGQTHHFLDLSCLDEALSSSMHQRCSSCPKDLFLYVFDSFSDVAESRVWFASKKLTPCALKWFPDRQNYSWVPKFSKHVWHAIGESRPFGWQIDSCKKTPKNIFFQRTKIGLTSLWEDLENKLVTPGQLLGFPWKLWGITVQTS